MTANMFKELQQGVRVWQGGESLLVGVNAFCIYVTAHCN